MKFISFILLLCFSMNVLASTGTVQELERQIDEYQYAMTVEWDQKDPAFQKAQTEAFVEKLNLLVKKQGLEKEELEKLVDKKIVNKQALAALKLKLSVLSSASSSKELASLLSEHSKDLYIQGASWNGDATTVLSVVAVVVIVGYLVWFSATHKCIAYEERWECNTSHTGSSSHSSCGWETYCSAWAKK